jgi:hypothetical protein
MRERIEQEPAPELEIDTPALPAVPYLNVLSISSVTKRVPYEGSGIQRPDGGVNHGFTNLKRHPERIDTIPELASDPALRSLMAAIDRPGTGLFGIACESKTIVDARGCRLSGYIEFALNAQDEVTDAASYFRLFHEFERRLWQEGFAEPVSFQWEICPTRFAEAGVDGFAVDVRVDTDHRPEMSSAYECWTRALAALEAVLAGVPARSGLPIYVRES